MKLLANPLFGITLSLVLFAIGQWLFKKTKGFFLFQPLFFAMVTGILCMILFAKGFHVSTADFYRTCYKPGGDLIFWFLTPATIAFAVPLYKRNDVVKKYWLEIILSLVIGTIISLIGMVVISKAIGLSHASTASMLSQAATTAIALPVSAAIGGIPSITALACILNAVVIYALGNWLVKIFRLNNDPIGCGLGLGTAGHTIGSAFALEQGSVQGAMAAIAVVIIGVVVDLVVPIFANLMNL